MRGTQQTASVNICSEDLSPPTSFELKCDEKLEYSLAQIFVAKISCNKVLDEIYRAFPGNDRLIPAKSISNAHTCIINTTVLHTIKAKMRYSNACDVTTRHIWNWRRLSGMYRRKGLALRANSIHCRWRRKRARNQNIAIAEKSDVCLCGYVCRILLVLIIRRLSCVRDLLFNFSTYVCSRFANKSQLQNTPLNTPPPPNFTWGLPAYCSLLLLFVCLFVCLWLFVCLFVCLKQKYT